MHKWSHSRFDCGVSGGVWRNVPHQVGHWRRKRSHLDSMVILEEGSFGPPHSHDMQSAASPNCDPDPDDDDVIYCAWKGGPSTITIEPCAVSSLFPFAFQLVESPDSEASRRRGPRACPPRRCAGGSTACRSRSTSPRTTLEGIETLDLKVISGTIESDLSIIIYDTPPFEPLAEELVIVPVMNRRCWTSTKTRTSNIRPCPTNGQSTAWTLKTHA